MDSDRNNDRKPDNRDKKPKGNLWVALLISAAVILVISLVYNHVLHSLQTESSYNHFLEAMEKNNLAEVELKHDRILYMTREEAAKEPSQQRAYFTGKPARSCCAVKTLPKNVLCEIEAIAEL